MAGSGFPLEERGATREIRRGDGAGAILCPQG
jgi:hypothetical protein